MVVRSTTTKISFLIARVKGSMILGLYSYETLGEAKQKMEELAYEHKGQGYYLKDVTILEVVQQITRKDIDKDLV